MIYIHTCGKSNPGTGRTEFAFDAVWSYVLPFITEILPGHLIYLSARPWKMGGRRCVRQFKQKKKGMIRKAISIQETGLCFT